MALLSSIARAFAGRKPGAASPKRGHAWFGAGLGLALSIVCATAFGAPPPREYQLKAVFLYNFVQFIEWPATAFPAPAAPLRIGILGEDPFGPALDEALGGESVRGRPLEVKRSRRADELKDCQLVFFAKSEAPRVSSQLAEFAGQPVLTVGEGDDFVRQGGGIAFYPEGRKIRFEINVPEARRRGLKISAELLGLGKTAAAGPGTGGN